MSYWVRKCNACSVRRLLKSEPNDTSTQAELLGQETQCLFSMEVVNSQPDDESISKPENVK